MARDIQGILSEHWSRHLDEPATETRLRTSALPVPTPAGPVLAATDTEGNRHILVPIPANQRSRRTIDGANLQVRESAIESEHDYQRYLDVCTVNRRLDSLFNDLGADLLVAIESAPDRAVAAANDVLSRWRALFAPAPRALSNDQIVGLFGELLTLQTLIESSPSATDTWLGPLGKPHDFVSGAGDIEVKSTADPESNRTRIHGIDQLDRIDERPLFVQWVRVRTDPTGESLVELALRISEAVDDRELFFERLAAAGVTPADQERYPERFAVVETVTIPVKDSFPRITPDALGRVDIALPIYAVEYSIDLPVTDALTPPKTRELMAKVAQGAAQ